MYKDGFIVNIGIFSWNCKFEYIPSLTSSVLLYFSLAFLTITKYFWNSLPVIARQKLKGLFIDKSSKIYL